MESKTCGECRYYAKETEHCKLLGIGWKFATDTPCSGFTPRKTITNGDKIRQMSNEELAELLADNSCGNCGFFSISQNGIERCIMPANDSCKYGKLAWLNAPAESEVNNG